jgi:hypothetical protein
MDAMHAGLEKSLSKLVGSAIAVSSGNEFPEPGHASIALVFADGTRLQAEYWRIIENGMAGVSSFDHNQKYGLPEIVDAVRELQEKLQSKTVVEAHHEEETGDLLFKFTGDIKIQILNLTGYEIWEIAFPDGRVQYSNYSK